MNNWIHVSFSVLVSSGYVPRSGIAGSKCGFTHRTRTKNFIVHMETQKIPNSESSLEKEEWNWKNQPS